MLISWLVLAVSFTTIFEDDLRILSEILSGYLMLVSWVALTVEIIMIFFLKKYDLKLLSEILSGKPMLVTYPALPVEILNIYEDDLRILPEILSG